MKRFVIVFTCFIVILLLSSCRSIDYADKYKDVKWISNDPKIEFTVYSESDGYNEGFLIVNDERIEIYCLWTLSNGLEIFYQDKIDKTAGGISHSSVAIYGNYKIKKGVVTLKISEDKVYDNKYETITFTMFDL